MKSNLNYSSGLHTSDALDISLFINVRVTTNYGLRKSMLFQLSRAISLLLLFSGCLLWQNAKAQLIYTVAGNTSVSYTGDGGLATAAAIGQPEGVAVDGAGNYYISDVENEVIRKVNSSGIISTIAGVGTLGYSGDGGPATNAAIFGPMGIALDGTGNIYFAEFSNSIIRMINTSGIITTIVGNGSSGYSGDGGPASSALLSTPACVATDGAGNLYISDYGNQVIRKVDAYGIITTIAGTAGYRGYTGDGGAATDAKLNYPNGICVDASGNLYIADSRNNVIRMVNTSGIINTYAGNGYGANLGYGGYSGDGGAATAAELDNPLGIAIDGSGNIYISDYYNQVIRK